LQSIYFSPGGILGGAMGMAEQLKKAQEVKQRAEAMNAEMSTKEVRAMDPTGLAQATVNGLGAPLRILVSPQLCEKVNRENHISFHIDKFL
jgi:DNA-binding protein YbaB